MILSGLSVVVLARHLGPENRGLYAAILIIPQMLISLFEGGVKQVTIHQLRSGVNVSEVSFKVLVLFLVNASFSAAICFLLLKKVSQYSSTISVIGAVVVVFTMALSYSQGLLIGREKLKVFNRTVWIQKLLLLIGFIVLFHMWGAEVKVALYVTVVAVAVTFLYAIYVIVISHNFEFRSVKGLFAFTVLGMKFAIALFIISANYRVDILMLSYMSESSSVGNYALSSQLVDMVWQVPAALAVVIMARAAEKESYSREWSHFIIATGKILFLLSVILVALLVAIVFFGGEAIFGAGYDDLWLILLILMPGIASMVLFKILNSDLAGKGRPMVSVFVMLPMVVLNVLLNFLLIPKYQHVGAAVSSSITYTLCGVLYFFIYCKFSGNNPSCFFSLKEEADFIKKKLGKKS